MHGPVKKSPQQWNDAVRCLAYPHLSSSSREFFRGCLKSWRSNSSSTNTNPIPPFMSSSSTIQPWQLLPSMKGETLFLLLLLSQILLSSLFGGFIVGSSSPGHPLLGIAPEGFQSFRFFFYRFMFEGCVFLGKKVVVWLLIGVWWYPDEKYYHASSDRIKCRDGSGKFSKAQLNDDFCDCLDGTDEPGICSLWSVVVLLFELMCCLRTEKLDGFVWFISFELYLLDWVGIDF